MRDLNLLPVGPMMNTSYLPAEAPLFLWDTFLFQPNGRVCDYIALKIVKHDIYGRRAVKKHLNFSNERYINVDPSPTVLLLSVLCGNQ